MTNRAAASFFALMTFTAAPIAHAQSVVDPSLSVTAIVPVGTLQRPTQIRFIGAGDFLVAEKDTGRIRRVQNGVLSPTIGLDLAVANDPESGRERVVGSAAVPS